MHETVKSDPLFKPHPDAGRPMQFIHIYTHTHMHTETHPCVHTHIYRRTHASHAKLKQAPYCGFVLKPVLTIRVCVSLPLCSSFSPSPSLRLCVFQMQICCTRILHAFLLCQWFVAVAFAARAATFWQHLQALAYL